MSKFNGWYLMEYIVGDQEFSHASDLYEQGLYKEAFEEFLRLAVEGDTSAMTRVACMYCDAEGVDSNLEQSIFWDKKAAELGNPTGFFNLGITYRNIGDMRNAKKYLLKALEDDDGEPALQLAKIYMISELETEKVIEYLTQAINSDFISQYSYEEALGLLKELTENK